MENNVRQQEAIDATEGPVLVIAGPGTGKTHTLVQRTVHLIRDCNVEPSSIMIATFTEKSAREIITRITDQCAAAELDVNFHEMYIGTFHSICLRLLDEYRAYTDLRQNYRCLDEFDQQFLVFQNLRRFGDYEELTTHLGSYSWAQAGKLCQCIDRLSEELIDAEALSRDEDPFLAFLGHAMIVYRNLLAEKNLLDFATMQTKVYEMLTTHGALLAKVRAKIRYLMVDEYQDTNYIQEQLAFLIGSPSYNICVFGDDDQALYRFRGATVRNILEYESKFGPDGCTVVALKTNYRSSKEIVDFCERWMETPATLPDGSRWTWGKCRLPKRIEPSASRLSGEALPVCRIDGDGAATGELAESLWHDRLTSFVWSLKDTGAIDDFNQVVFLMGSVRDSDNRAARLMRAFEAQGIDVYAPRSGRYFEQEEVMAVLGCLLHVLPVELSAHLSDSYRAYLDACVLAAQRWIDDRACGALYEWIEARRAELEHLEKTTDYGYVGLVYQLFGCEPFVGMLGANVGGGVMATRRARNLAKLTEIIRNYEVIEGIDVLRPTTVTEVRHRKSSDKEKYWYGLINTYLARLYECQLNEYEDEAEYAPSGCVSFMTIHQAKGLEFPVVIVDSLDWKPGKGEKSDLDRIIERYTGRVSFEPPELIKQFDFWRQFYTAFSRAQDLLVLTCAERPSVAFQGFFDALPEAMSLSFSRGDFQAIKSVHVKRSFSFTSHIAYYESCPLQYKFFKELRFKPVRVHYMVFGTLVHQTIEDIHKAAMRGESPESVAEHLDEWLEDNLGALERSEHAKLPKKNVTEARRQVRRYFERCRRSWGAIYKAEEDVTVAYPDYILEGKVDLIRGAGDSVEIVDFKTGVDPRDNRDGLDVSELQRRYERQLLVYAHLVEKRTGLPVSAMHVHYTGSCQPDPETTIVYDHEQAAPTLEAFDDVIQKILLKDFSERAIDREGPRKNKPCANCDFRYYCGFTSPVKEAKATLAASGVARSSDDEGETFIGRWKGRSVEVERTAFGHRFTDEEVAWLLAGESLEFDAVGKSGEPYAARGHLVERDGKVRFRMDFQCAADHTVPPYKYCGHELNEVERDLLRRGHTVHRDNWRSKRTGTFAGDLAWTSDQGPKIVTHA